MCSFICLSVCGYGTTYIKITQLRGSGSSVRCVCLFMCVNVSMNYLSVGMGPHTKNYLTFVVEILLQEHRMHPGRARWGRES